MVKRNEPLAPTHECIVVPRQVLDGLFMALHIQLDHLSSHQLKMVAHWNCFTLDIDKAIDRVSDSCHFWAAHRPTHHTLIEQSTTDLPHTHGVSFAADITKCNQQCIIVMKEGVTSFTATMIIIENGTLSDALLHLCIKMHQLDSPFAVIHNDLALVFRSLVDDKLLHCHRMAIKIKRVKNCNKNPVAEKAVQEIENKLI